MSEITLQQYLMNAVTKSIKRCIDMGLPLPISGIRVQGKKPYQVMRLTPKFLNYGSDDPQLLEFLALAIGRAYLMGGNPLDSKQELIQKFRQSEFWFYTTLQKMYEDMAEALGDDFFNFATSPEFRKGCQPFEDIESPPSFKTATASYTTRNPISEPTRVGAAFCLLATEAAILRDAGCPYKKIEVHVKEKLKDMDFGLFANYKSYDQVLILSKKLPFWL